VGCNLKVDFHFNRQTAFHTLVEEYIIGKSNSLGRRLLCISFIICIIFQVWFFNGNVGGNIRACKSHYLQSSVIQHHGHLVQMLQAWIPLHVSRHVQQSSFLVASAKEPVGKVVSSKDLMLRSFQWVWFLLGGIQLSEKLKSGIIWHCWDCALHIHSRRILWWSR